MNTKYEIVYNTQNTYEENVREAFFSFLIIPCQNETQKVHSLFFHNSLQEKVFYQRNSFGFELVRLHSTKPFKEFKFRMTALVEKKMAFFPFSGQLSAAEEQNILNGYDFFIDNHLYLGTSHYTFIEDVYRSKLFFQKEGQFVYDYLLQLNSFINQLLEFDPEPTQVCTTASEVLKIGRGVCQDFTHLFIGLARLNKIPCRYVSGYLNQGLNLTGTAVMHAWAEAFVPGFGWQGFDPTNSLLADVHYIKAAHGSDYNDCSPLKGVLKTNGKQKTNYGVKITPQLMAGAGANQ
jgi:transglutaminase-like putative cysteine protease